MGTTTLDRLHQVHLEMLDEIDRLCCKYGLSYWLDSGSALGAIRHKGFILWDDDASVVLVKYWGICGVIAGTILAYWTTFLVTDPVVLHKYGFNGKYSVRNFYFTVLFNMAVVVLIGFVLKITCSYVLPGRGWISVILHAMLCAVITPIVLFVVNWKKDETRYLVLLLKKKFLRVN